MKSQTAKSPTTMDYWSSGHHHRWKLHVISRWMSGENKVPAFCARRRHIPGSCQLGKECWRVTATSLESFMAWQEVCEQGPPSLSTKPATSSSSHLFWMYVNFKLRKSYTAVWWNESRLANYTQTQPRTEGDTEWFVWRKEVCLKRTQLWAGWHHLRR